MKTVTQGFTDAWKKKAGGQTVQQIQYKRRYWNGSAFVYESSWQTLTLSKFERVGEIISKLDFPALNQFRTSNVTLYLNNAHGAWFPWATQGIFGPDAVAASGYEAFKTKFQILYGYVKADGTTELCTMFTGYYVDDNFYTDIGYAEILLSGLEYDLITNDAQLVSTTFTDENTTANGDGSTKVFTTTSQGVGFIKNVKVAGVLKTQGVDYTLGNLNVYGAGATITFTTAPASSNQPTASGSKWYVNQNIETLVTDLLVQAGISSYSVSPALFPGGLSGSKSINTQASWQAGTGTDTDTASTVNSIQAMGFSAFGAGAPSWTAYFGSWTFNSNGAGAYGNNAGDVKIQASTPSTQATGTWRFNPNQGSGEGNTSYFYFMSNGTEDVHLGSIAFGWVQGYAITWIANQNPGNYTFKLYKTNGSGTATQLATYTNNSTFEIPGQVTITRDGTGLTTVYVNGTQILQATDNTTTTSNYIIFSYDGTVASVNQYTNGITQMLTSTSIIPGGQNFVSTATWISAEQDLLSIPTAWGQLVMVAAANGWTLALSTAVASSSGGTYDAYVAVDSHNVIQSALKRYLKIKVVWTLAPTNNTLDASVSSLIANFLQTSVPVTLANFTSLNCYQAIQLLAQLCDYEYGFDGTGKFFFRAKSVANSPVLYLNQTFPIQKIQNCKSGYDAVINDGQVSYGSYYNEYNSSSLPETAPKSQDIYGTIISNQSLTNFLLANDANLGAARAQVLHDNNYRKRRRAKVICKTIPQVDISDVVSLSYFDRQIDLDNIAGDPLRTWGDKDTPFGLRDTVMFRNTSVKIIGITFKPESEQENGTVELDVQEVL